jgi:hypothetical protein
MSDMFTGAGVPLSKAGFDGALATIDPAGDPASLWSILAVETRGFGYLLDKRPKILFERHIFAKRTGGRFSAAHPDISNPTPGGYKGGAAEYARLARAMALNETAAIESASWGLGQVMGFNASSLGYAGAKDMVEAFKASEDAQLDGCARFIARNPALQNAFNDKNWARVAFFYNGSNFAENHYDIKLADAHQSYSNSLPSVDVRAGQARLVYAGFGPLDIDGVAGPATKRALLLFQVRKNLPQSGGFDAATDAALRTAAGA